MATLACVCLLAILAATVQASTVVEKQPTLDATSVDLYQQLLGRVEHLEKRDQDQQAEIDTLRSELYAEKQRTSILEEVVASLRSRDRETSEDDDGLNDAELPSNEYHRDFEKHPGQHSSRIVRRQAEVPVVAFFATLQDGQLHMAANQTVAFDNVITNIGGAYNQHVGIFVAPVPGVYVFYTEILGYRSLQLSVVKNGSMVAMLLVRDETLFDNDSAMVVLHLAKGDRVAVQNNESGKYVYGNNFSMFSGFILHEDVQTDSIVG